MGKQKKTSDKSRSTTGFEHLAATSDLYSTTPTESPLYDRDRPHHSAETKTTSKHRKQRRKETPDQRDKQALIAVLRLSILLVLILIAFVLLWRGIGIYQEQTVLKHVADVELPPVLQNLPKQTQSTEESSDISFSERINRWKSSDRMVRSADAFLLGDHIDRAIDRCNEALALNPSHFKALERLAELYYEDGKYVESVNAYIRLLSIEPANADIQRNLIKALDAFGDYKAVSEMAEWYLTENMFNADVQRYFANALFSEEDYDTAINVYLRVLEDTPDDIQALERLVECFLVTGEYEQALEPLIKLRSNNYREPEYHRLIALCRAELGRPEETVNALSRAIQIVDKNTVISWLPNSSFNKVRDNRSFKAFTEDLGGEDLRKWLEKVAKEDSYSSESGALLGGDKTTGQLKEQRLRLQSNKR